MLLSWGNRMLVDSYDGSFQYALLSTSKTWAVKLGMWIRLRPEELQTPNPCWLQPRLVTYQKIGSRIDFCISMIGRFIVNEKYQRLNDKKHWQTLDALNVTWHIFCRVHDYPNQLHIIFTMSIEQGGHGLANLGPLISGYSKMTIAMEKLRYYNHLEVSWNGGTPSYHPFSIGCFPNKNHL